MSKNHLLTFILVADTNALFPKDPAKLVSDKFLAKWNECAKLANLRFLIPEVVRGERLYQLVCVAQDSLVNAGKNFDSVAKVSGVTMTSLPSIATIKSAIEDRFEAWAKSKGVEIASVPYGTINWPSVVHDSIWRIAPFSPTHEGKDSEKGFRDRMILETLADVLSKSDVQVIFISGDTLLRESAIARFDSNLFAAYENIEGFYSYLTVTRTQMAEAERQTTQKIIQAAPKVFYSADNPKCVYTTFNIYQRIAQQYAAELACLDEPRTIDADNEVTIEAISRERVFIDSTQYDPTIAKAKSWGWKTRVKLVRMFRRKTVYKQETPSAEDAKFADLLEDFRKRREELDEALKSNQIVRAAPFDVFWTATCNHDATFTRLKLVSIKPLPHEQELGLFKYKYGFTDDVAASQPANA
jgi:hypothetical protein